MQPPPPMTMIPDPADARNATFVFLQEDHTLGNALRYMLIKHPKTHFCGYSIPHPSEAKMHFRLQSSDPELSAKDLLHEGVDSLKEMLHHIDSEFTKELARFQAAQPTQTGPASQSQSAPIDKE
ncbi:putative DNA-directed RNA polymerase I and III subunit Rpc19 [Paratrimastix pyriformis]|uniref:DNA-directed RNA polymerase I and III subunit Rpc19 n=1 Tax=Paratrimastix pyriformis TaxID=342808 RepID=A0ABQ8UZ72_9EUKA|nr:putative DNA-directed RNA polymerase I and III subunit Rpc19 [Paratrimastix pyriformis]